MKTIESPFVLTMKEREELARLAVRVRVVQAFAFGASFGMLFAGVLVWMCRH